MSSIDQYIQLARQQRKLLDSHSTRLLNQWRDRAFEALKGKRLPEKGDEGYEHTSIEQMFEPDRGVNIARIPIPADLSATFRCGLPNVTTALAYVVNDTFTPSRDLQKRLPDGVVFCSIAEAVEKHPDLISQYFGTMAPLDYPTVALNTLLLQDGAFIYIPPRTKLNKPLQILNILNAVAPLLALRRILVVVGEGASAQILSCDHTLSGAGNILSSIVAEIFVEQNAVLDYCEMEETDPSTCRMADIFVRQERQTDVSINGITLRNGTTRNNYHIDIAGPDCLTRLSGMAIGSDDCITDNSSRVRHIAPRSDSRQLFKYVLDDSSVGSFEGNILVTPDAPFTQAYQSNRNIIASTKAKMYTRPQLEIYNDDVKCSHGATTGQLDNEALFYMRTRGIPEHEARVMLMQAFMADVIDSVRIESLRERLRHLVEQRFAGTTVACGQCNSSCKKIEDENR